MKKIVLCFIVLINFIFAENYGVGAKVFRFTDESREELLTKDPMDKREIVFKVWYPTKFDPKAETVPLLFGEPAFPFQQALALEFGISTEKLESFRSKTIYDAKIIDSNKKFPLIVYNHGNGSLMEDNQTLIESLVEKGIVVVSVTHKYQSMGVLDKNNEVIHYDPSAQIEKSLIKEGYSELDFYTLIESLKNKKIDETYKENFYKLYDLIIGDKGNLNYWTKDSLSALKNLEELNIKEFRGLIDTSRYIAMGYSYGGSTSSILMNTDARCIAGINIDGEHYGIEKSFKFDKNYLGLISDLTPFGEDFRFIKSLAKEKFNYVQFKKSGHYNFSELPKLVPEFKSEPSENNPLPIIGMIDEYYMSDKVNEIVGNFVDSIYGKKDFPKYFNSLKADNNLRLNPFN